MFYRRHATQDQIDAHRDAIRTELDGQGFNINSNGYGLHIQCERCRESNTLNPEMWARNHKCATVGRVADYREVTVNADGTTNSILYYA